MNCIPVLFAVCASLSGAVGGVRSERRAARHFGLERLATERALRAAIARGDLVRVPDVGANFFLDPGLAAGEPDPSLYRHARPNVLRFIERLADQYRHRFNKLLQVNSLVRTAAYHRALRRRNGNATRGVSSHEYGTTVDISKLALSARGASWIRTVLLSLERRGLILATEEHAQAVFHVMVLPTYRR